MKLDATDKRILEMLQEDAKMNVKEMAEVLNLSKTPIYDRIKRLEKEGVIDRYVAVLNRDKLESSMVVFCSVSLESQKLDAIQAFGKAIDKIPEVQECYLMGGESDFLLRVVVKDLHAYHQFSSGKLAALPNVSQIQSSFVLHVEKRSTGIPIL